jgi:D-xylose transport system permease protein
MAATGDGPAGGVAPAGAGAGPEATVDLTAAAVEVIPPEVVAQTLGQYLRAWFARVRSGDAGVLPVVLALVVLSVYFQMVSPHNVFLSPGNLVNLFIQAAVFMVLAMAESFVLLLGEIDLSVGYVAAIGGILAANLVQVSGNTHTFDWYNWPWWAAIVAALAVCALIGALQGFIITRLRLPSFVVTLAGLMLWQGVMIAILGAAGGVIVAADESNPEVAQKLHNQLVLFNIVWGEIPPLAGWIGLLAVVVLGGAVMWLRDARRRRSGLVAPPVGLTVLKILLLALAGITVVTICNMNRGVQNVVEGMPWVMPIILLLLVAWTVLLEQTKFGRHVYAVGGSAEAARRAGVNVAAVRTMGFVLCSFTAGIGGIIYCSFQGGMTTNINGGQLVLYAVAAAVIGGTSLFGGRGRAIHGLLGGLVIAAISNGLYLLGFKIQEQLIVTGLVLLAAVTIDTLSRRGAVSGGTARA